MASSWNDIIGALMDGARSANPPDQGVQPLPASSPTVAPQWNGTLQQIMNGWAAGQPTGASAAQQEFAHGSANADMGQINPQSPAVWDRPMPAVQPALLSGGLYNIANRTPAPASVSAPPAVDHSIAGPNSISPNKSTVWSPDNGQTVYILHPDNSLETRTGGTPSWRDNSPGNVALARGPEIGSFCVPQRPKDGKSYIQRRAVFDSPEEGMASLRRQFFDPKSKFVNRSIYDVMHDYASGPADDIENYLKHIRQFGLDRSVVLNSLSPEQQDSFLSAIKAHEKWTEGNVTWE